jgi:hypothetical protein
MRIKILLSAFALFAMPGLAYAQCSMGSGEATMSCAEGLTWDAASRSCVANATS